MLPTVCNGKFLNYTIYIFYLNIFIICTFCEVKNIFRNLYFGNPMLVVTARPGVSGVCYSRRCGWDIIAFTSSWRPTQIWLCPLKYVIASQVLSINLRSFSPPDVYTGTPSLCVVSDGVWSEGPLKTYCEVRYAKK